MDTLLHMGIGLLRRLAMLGLTAVVGYLLVRWLARPATRRSIDAADDKP